MGPNGFPFLLPLVTSAIAGRTSQYGGPVVMRQW
jgi:hypothetical protein